MEKKNRAAQETLKYAERISTGRRQLTLDLEAACLYLAGGGEMRARVNGDGFRYEIDHCSE